MIRRHGRRRAGGHEDVGVGAGREDAGPAFHRAVIGGDRDDLDPVLPAQLLRRGLEPRRTARTDHEVDAFGGQHLRGSQAHARTRPIDEGATPPDSHVHPRIPLPFLPL